MLFPTNHMAALGTHSPLPNINAQQSWQEKRKKSPHAFILLSKLTRVGKKNLKRWHRKHKLNTTPRQENEVVRLLVCQYFEYLKFNIFVR